MSSILYYSNYCNNCKTLLQTVSKSSKKKDTYFICIDKRIKKNNKTYVVLETGQEILFNEIGDYKQLSTIDSFSKSDNASKYRKNGNKYKVKTISLLDLLKKYKAPKYIDYLSIDTEGSEYEILKAFDFSKYRISVITCEHNFSNRRGKIFKLLNKNGYQRVFQGLSRWDDWYIKIED